MAYYICKKHPCYSTKTTWWKFKWWIVENTAGWSWRNNQFNTHYLWQYWWCEHYCCTQSNAVTEHENKCCHDTTYNIPKGRCVLLQILATSSTCMEWVLDSMEKESFRYSAVSLEMELPKTKFWGWWCSVRVERFDEK